MSHKIDIKAAIRVLCEKYPALFVAERSMPHKPLKIGVHNDIIAAAILPPNEIRAAIGHYRGRLQYQKALAAGGPRFDLDGNPCGEITADQAAGAVAMIARIEAKRVASSQAAKVAWRQAAGDKESPPNGKPSVQEKPAPAVAESAADAPKRLGLADLKAAARARRGEAAAGRP